MLRATIKITLKLFTLQCKVSNIFIIFQQFVEFVDKFHKSAQYQILQKLVSWQWREGRTHRRT
jgi:hypothetical protein